MMSTELKQATGDFKAEASGGRRWSMDDLGLRQRMFLADYYAELMDTENELFDIDSKERREGAKKKSQLRVIAANQGLDFTEFTHVTFVIQQQIESEAEIKDDKIIMAFTGTTQEDQQEREDLIAQAAELPIFSDIESEKNKRELAVEYLLDRFDTAWRHAEEEATQS